jgi:hypothetical protein
VLFSIIRTWACSAKDGHFPTTPLSQVWAMLNAVMVKFWQHFNAIFLPHMATQNPFKRVSILPIMAKFDCMMKWLAWSMKSHSTVVKSMPL